MTNANGARAQKPRKLTESEQARLERVRSAITASKLSAPEIARRSGVNPNTMKSGINGIRAFSAETCEKISRTLKRDWRWLYTGDEMVDATTTTKIQIMQPVARTDWHLLPLYGVDPMSLDGKVLFGSSPIGVAISPASLFEVPDACAAYVPHAKLEPRYYENEVVYVNPSKRPTIGCYVLVKFKPEIPGGAVYGEIGKLLYRDDQIVRLGSHNPEGSVDYQMEAVLCVHRIVQSGEI